MIRFLLLDIVRNRVLIGYTLFLLLSTIGVIALEDGSSKALLSLSNVVLIIVPLVSSLFTSIFYYNSSELISLLLSQPIKRKQLWLALYSSIGIALSIAFLVGSGLILGFSFPSIQGLFLVLGGLFNTWIFCGLSMLASVRIRDKARGIGAVVSLWLYFSVLFDGLMLFLMFQFADYPIERPSLLLSFLNPVDIIRIGWLLQMDTSALMGYTGAVYKEILGNWLGLLPAIGMLLVWTWLPYRAGKRVFEKRDW